MAMRYTLTISFPVPLQQLPTNRTQIINSSFHITPAVTPMEATGHAAIHNVARNSTYFQKKKKLMTKRNVDTNTFSGVTHYKRILLYRFHGLKRTSGAFAKFRMATKTFVTSGRQHGTIWLPLEGFLKYLIKEGFFRKSVEKKVMFY
jgi:hypothetical protein